MMIDNSPNKFLFENLIEIWCWGLSAVPHQFEVNMIIKGFHKLSFVFSLSLLRQVGGDCGARA